MLQFPTTVMKLSLFLGAIHFCGAIPLDSSAALNTQSGKTVDFRYPVAEDLPDNGPGIVKVRYGPYTVRADSEHNTIMLNMKKPCILDCWITAMQGGLEWADGAVANANEGAWLHHMQMNRIQLGKTDLTCLTQTGERIYAVGNEREVSRMNAKAKYGVSAWLIEEAKILDSQSLDSFESYRYVHRFAGVDE